MESLSDLLSLHNKAALEHWGLWTGHHLVLSADENVFLWLMAIGQKMGMYAVLILTSLRPFQLFYCMFIQLWLKTSHVNVSHQIPVSKTQRFSRNEICIFIFFWFYMQTIVVQCDRDRAFLQIHVLSKQLRYGRKAYRKMWNPKVPKASPNYSSIPISNL